MAVNIFTTDHPMTAQAPRRMPRWLKRILLILVSFYPAYLLLLGPFWGLDGRGYLTFIPDKAREKVYAPLVLIAKNDFTRHIYSCYLDFWYEDPDGSMTTEE